MHWCMGTERHVCMMRVGLNRLMRSSIQQAHPLFPPCLQEKAVMKLDVGQVR